jgi:DMSO/TMAO reductase YedYZ heme-binding membrane subunit
MSSAAARPTASPDTGRKVHFALVALFMVLVAVQFYLAGRGAFGADTYDAHETVGGIAHLVTLVILIATIAIPSTRNRQDIGMAAALFVLMTIHAAIADRDHPQLGAFHPVTALLLTGLGFHLISRDRRVLSGT